MKLLPYFKWYPADADSDELYVSLNDQELGFYHRLLNKSWANCGLPQDLDELACLMKVKRAYVDKLWPKVGRCFTATDAIKPRLVNPRQEKERQYAIAKSERATDSVRARYGRRTDDGLRAYESESCVGSKKKVQKISGPLDFQLINEAWKWYQEEFPGEVNTFIETQLFLSVVESEQDLSDLRQNLPAYKLTQKWIDGFHPSSENFLSKRIFKIRPKARDTPKPKVYDGPPLPKWDPIATIAEIKRKQQEEWDAGAEGRAEDEKWYAERKAKQEAEKRLSQ